MTVRTFLIGSFLATLTFSGIWLLVINWIDPAAADVLGFILFFTSLFLAVTGLVSLIGYGLRVILYPQQLPAYRVRPALRQGLWTSAFLNILLFLQLERLLRWWVALIIAVLIICIELVYLGYDKSARRQ